MPIITLIYMLIGMYIAMLWDKKHNIVNTTPNSFGSFIGNMLGFFLTAAIWPIILYKLIK